ncbi:MAG: Gfo/Idh/MocA family oxidoreductase [Chloroflexota bacterium]
MQRLEVYGTDGSILAGSSANERPAIRMFSQRLNSEVLAGIMEIRVPEPDPWALTIQEFIDCIIEDRQPATTADDGQRALAVVLAAYQSAAQKRPVNVDELDPAFASLV